MAQLIVLFCLLGADGSVTTGILKPCFATRSLRRDGAHLLPPDDAFPWRLEEAFRTDAAVFHRLTFPSPVKSPVECNDTVWCEYMVPRAAVPDGGDSSKGQQRIPAVVVLHFLNDKEFLVTRFVCIGLAQRGVAALLLKMPYYGERRPPGNLESRLQDLDLWASTFTQAVQDIRRALAWLRARPEVDPERTGIVGISLGALVGSLATAVDADVRRSVLILGGGNLHEILWTAPETRKLRASLQARGIGQEETARALETVEPLRFAGAVPAGTVLLVNARKDTTVPTGCVDALARAFGGCDVSWYDTTHVGLASHLAEILGSVADFIRGPIGPIGPAPPR